MPSPATGPSTRRPSLASSSQQPNGAWLTGQHAYIQRPLETPDGACAFQPRLPRQSLPEVRGASAKSTMAGGRAPGQAGAGL